MGERVPFSAAGQATRATWYDAAEPTAVPPIRRTTLLIAPGAGAGQDHPFMVSLAAALVAHGLNVVTFDFPYVAAGRRRPDRAEVLEHAWREAIAMARARMADDGRLFIGGKSMGGRLATHVAASHRAADLGISGVVCFGYPLNPPYRREARSLDHLPAIDVPVLVLQGTRDAFGGPEDMTRAAGDAPGVEVQPVAGADHGFAVPKSSGRSRAEVLAALASTVAAWMVRIGSSV